MKRGAVALAVAAGLCGGCYQHTYVVSGTTPEESPSLREWRHHLFNGLIDLSDDVDLRAACPQGVARIENGMTWYNAIFYLLSATIYTPTVAEIYCQEPAEVSAPAALPVPPEPAVPIVDHTALVDASSGPGPEEALDAGVAPLRGEF